MVQDKGGGEQENDLQVGVGHGEDLLIRAQEKGQGPGEKQSGGHIDQSGRQGQDQGVGEDGVRLPSAVPPPVDGVLDGAAHAQHHTGAHHQADDGQGQIQGGQALGAQPPGDEEGVR